MRRERQTGRWAALAVFAAASAAAVLLASRITLYCDDYFYGVFFREGWDRFWELTKWHYLHFNGRAFVHFVAELALQFDTALYILLFPAMLACVFLLGGRLQSGGISWNLLLMTGGVGVMASLALPPVYLRSSLLWISAAFNYLFPLCVLLPTLWMYMREEGSAGGWTLTLVLSFLSGATTEQSGLAAVVCLGGWGLLAWLRRERTFWRGLLPGLLACAGYLTVIFAPGTWVRIGNENNSLMRILDPAVLKERFWLSMHYLTGGEGLPLLFVVFALLTAVHALLRGPKALLSGFAAAPVYLLLYRSGQELPCEALTVFYILLAAGVYLWRRKTIVRGLFLLGALAAQLIMMANVAAAPRTAIPAILLMLSVCASLLAECLEPFPVWAGGMVCAAAMAGCFLLFLPTYKGYAANAEVHARNIAALRDPQSKTAVLDLRLDGTYRYSMYFESAAYLDNAVVYYRAENKRLSYLDDQGPRPGLTNGKQSGLPIFEEEGGPVFPIVNTIVLCGGEAEWNYALGGTQACLNGVSCLFRPSGESFFLDPKTGEIVGEAFHADVYMPWYTYYVTGDTLRELFGVTWSYHSQGNVYYVQAGGTTS